MTAEWDDVSYVISSKYRVDTLERLEGGPATPSLVASDTEHSIAHISRALQELQDEELVTLLVSEDQRKGRVYGTTERGQTVIEMIQAENMT